MFNMHCKKIPAMKLLLLCLFALLTTLPTFEAATVKQTWVVEYAYRSPDCYKKLVITINGTSPGPTIEAVQGDEVVVEVKNNLLAENVAIHWHGIRQIGTPWFDGTEGVTQCSIQPKDTFVYKFVVDRAGTYMYHGHYGMQLSKGLYGMIIVRPHPGVAEPFDYQDDRQILLTDWYHKTTQELATRMLSIPFAWVGEPDSLLIQGRGKFDCKKPQVEALICNAENPECSPYTLTVKAGQTIRLRLGSLASLSSLSFEIEGHSMTVVEADGYYVEPFTVNHLYIYSGETYSVLIHTNQNPSRNYWMVTKVVAHENKTSKAKPLLTYASNGLAILNYAPNPPSIPSTPPPTGPMWNNTSDRIQQSVAIKAHHDYIIPPPKKPDRVFLFLSTQNKIEGKIRWCMNNVSLNLPTTPYLIAIKKNLSNTFDQNPPPDTYDYANFDMYSIPKNLEGNEGNGIHRIKFNTTVDFILQNTATFLPPNNSETHPWHLHGHDFWVLAHGRGKFDPTKDTENFNLVNPIMKSTVPLHTYGWTALRFVADNPGVWAFHCHVEFHLFMGMGVIFESGIDKVGELPKSIMGCGDTKGLV